MDDNEITIFRKLKLKNNTFTYLLLFYWLSAGFLMTVSRFFLNKLGVVDSLFRTVFINIFLFIPILFSLYHLRHIKGKKIELNILFFFVIYFVIIGTFIFNSDCRYFIMRSKYGIERVLLPFSAIYAFFFFSLIDNPVKTFFVVKLYSILDFFSILIVELIPRIVNGYFEDVNYLGILVKRNYSLSFGYSMVFPIIVFLYIFLKKKHNYLYLLASVFGTFLIFIYGNRGALLIIFIFIFLLMLTSVLDNSNKRKRILKFISIIFLCVIVLIFKEKLLDFIINFFDNIGIESRTLKMLKSDNLMNSSGRDEIWEEVLKAISKSPIFGYGFFGDRSFVYPLHFVAYSHNIFLELIASFGVFGFFFSLVIIFFSFYMIFFCKNKDWRDLFIIFFSVACQLLLSNSLWYCMEFWAAIAITMNYFNEKNIYKKV